MNRFTTQASALGLALLITLCTLGAVNTLATREHAGYAAANAQTEVAVQQVVITARRLPRT
jgi:nitrate reductase gamma subunit